MAAGLDDHVLDAAGDEDVTIGDVGPVVALEPFAVEQRAGLLRIAEIALGRGGPFELQAPFGAIRHFAIRIVDDADLVARNRAPAGDELESGGIVCAGRDGSAIA